MKGLLIQAGLMAMSLVRPAVAEVSVALCFGVVTEGSSQVPALLTRLATDLDSNCRRCIFLVRVPLAAGWDSGQLL
jgi:hypothetical protein